MTNDPEALAVLIAALDGHDAATTATVSEDGGVTITATGSREPSDLDLTIVDCLSTTAPHHAVKEVARVALSVMGATAITLGHDFQTPDPAKVAEVLRAMLRGAREVGVDDD